MFCMTEQGIFKKGNALFRSLFWCRQTKELPLSTIGSQNRDFHPLVLSWYFLSWKILYSTEDCWTCRKGHLVWSLKFPPYGSGTRFVCTSVHVKLFFKWRRLEYSNLYSDLRCGGVFTFYRNKENVKWFEPWNFFFRISFMQIISNFTARKI